MVTFGLRNLELFLKDRSAVALSFLAECIIIILYVLFLRDNLLETFSQIKDAELIMDVWMMAGILGITSATTTMGVYGIMVDDKAKRLDRDFRTAPVGKGTLLGGYLLSAAAIGLFLSFLALLVGEAYLYAIYGITAGLEDLLYLYGLLVINAVSNSAIVLLLVSFLKTSNALAACCTILGALVGFLTGIYLPMGTMSETVQLVVKCFPISHGVVLLRQALTQPLVVERFGSENQQAAEAFMEYMGICYVWEGSTLTTLDSLCFLLVCAVVCMTCAFLKFMGKRKL